MALAPTIANTVSMPPSHEAPGLASPLLSPLSEAEIAIHAILELLERNKINDKANGQVPSHTELDNDALADSTLSLDSNAQLVQGVNAILENYQVGKEQIPRSGVAALDLDLPHYNGNGQLPLIQRVSDTETDPLNIQLRNTTHPLVHSNDHVEKFADFVNDMMAAGRRQRTRRPKYNNVEVLVLTWDEEEDAEDEAKEINKLIEDEVKVVHKLFRETLRFSVESYSIPTFDAKKKQQVNSQAKLQLKISSFVDKHDNKDTLLIIYYNGHGSYWKDSCYWHPTEAASEQYSGFNPEGEFRGPSLKWNTIQSSIVTEADVLIILDCCYAGASLIDTKGTRTTKEILTACGKAQKTPAGPDSFSMRFVDSVNEMLQEKSRFRITDLYGRMVSSAKKPDPLHVIRGPGSIVIEAQPDPDKRNTLDLEIPKQNNHAHGTSPTSSISALDHESIFSQGLNPPVAHSELSSTSLNSRSLLVTLVVRVKDDVKPTFANWEASVNALPPEEVVGLESVKVEAAFPTNSTLLIVSMPISIWLLLPENPAYTFIGFVKGNNVLLPKRPPPEPLPNGISVARSDLEKSKSKMEGDWDIAPYIISAIKEFFEHAPDRKEKTGTIRNIATKIGLHSRLEADPRYGFVRHIMQRFVVVHNEQGESHVSYDLHFTEIEKLFEMGKKSVKEALHNASSKNGDLETTVTAKIDQLEKEVLTLVEGEKRGKTYSFEPKVSADKIPAQGHVRSWSDVSKIAQHEAPIPKNKAATSPRMQIRTGSENLAAGISRIDSSVSMRKKSRTGSTTSKQGILRSDSRPHLMSLLGGRFSRESARPSSPMQSPMQSPRASGHLPSYAGVEVGSEA